MPAIHGFAKERIGNSGRKWPSLHGTAESARSSWRVWRRLIRDKLRDSPVDFCFDIRWRLADESITLPDPDKEPSMKVRNSDLIRNAALLTSHQSRNSFGSLLSEQCSCFHSRAKDFEPSPWNHRIDCEYRKLMFRCIELYRHHSDPHSPEVNW